MKAMRLLPNRAAQPALAKPTTEPPRNPASGEALKRADASRYTAMREQLRAELDRLSAALAATADGQRQGLAARRRRVAHELAVVDALLAPPES